MDQRTGQVVDGVESAEADDEIVGPVGYGLLFVEILRGLDTRNLAASSFQRPRKAPCHIADDQRALRIMAQESEPLGHIFGVVVA